jgi:alpha-1,3-rhamnosyl/mannosyltransferase
VRLEIVGENRTVPHVDVDGLARASLAGDRIGVRSYVTADVLASLYASASLFVFLSDYEGFGLTPLDALASGIPVLLLDTPVAREIYGEAAYYVPRADPSLISAAIDRLLFDQDERNRLLRVAPSVVARYSWQVCAERVLDTLLVCGAG